MAPKTPTDTENWKARTGTLLRRHFITGLAALFPIWVTFFAVGKLFQFADGLLGRYINAYLLRAYGYEIPGLGLLITILLIFVAGMFSSHFFGRWMLRVFEDWFGRLPIVGRIYQPVKQLGQFLFENGKGKDTREPAFRRVVLAQYPRLGAYTVAFVTNETTTDALGAPKTLLTLLLPNPPSPFTGPLIFVPKEDVIPLTMTVEEAVKFIVSGGVVAPPLLGAQKGTG